MTRPVARAVGERGFTLVELLVGLVVLALVMQLAFGALRFSADAWDRVSRSAVAIDERSSIARFLQARLAAVSQPNPPQAGPGNSVQWWFDGTSDEMTFVAPWVRPVAPGGLYRFRVWRERSGETEVLKLSWRPEIRGAEDALLTEWSGEREVLEDVTRLALRYFGGQDGRAPEWHRTWSQTAAMPKLVEVTITTGEPGAPWAPLVIATGF